MTDILRRVLLYIVNALYTIRVKTRRFAIEIDLQTRKNGVKRTLDGRRERNALSL